MPKVRLIREKYPEALPYHKGGKLRVLPSKKLLTKYDLSLAYTPGVAIPCVEIENDPMNAYEYTTKSNLIAVISNGTAVLGLGDIGALASKPVMEGKAVLFKAFANINAFDIEVDEKDPFEFVKVVRAIAPTFGGINLEDIKAPECFLIERLLREQLEIPVMHDDQHGTAIIVAAGLMNALELTAKEMEEVRIVLLGGGAASVACGRMLRTLGARGMVMVDSTGVVHTGRTDLHESKAEFAVSTPKRTLEEALEGADVVIGLARGNLLSEEMLLSLAPEPIVFALSNPTPEVLPELVEKVRPDAVVATGRSDYPNQINNALGFPYIFRGALDVRAREINTAMMHAAAQALADLAKCDIPDALRDSFQIGPLTYGRHYLVPFPFDKRLMPRVAGAVARAAMESGVARVQLDLQEYTLHLDALCLEGCQ